MKKILKIIFSIAILFPSLAHAQLFNQNQIIQTPSFGLGFVYSTSTAGNGKLFATSTIPGLNIASTSVACLTVDPPTFVINCLNHEVGIGSTTPSKLLTVYQGASGQAPNADSKAVIESNTNNGLSLLAPNNAYQAITFGTPSSNSQAGIFATGNTYSGSLAPNTLSFSAGGTLNRMVINGATGNVGVGTTSPTNNLVVAGTGTVTSQVNSSASTGVSILQALNASAGFIDTRAYGSAAVGTILGQNAAGSVDIVGSPTSVMALGTFSNTPLAFGTNNAERMRIDATGNIGIGTTSPAATFAVNGGGYFADTTTFNVSAGGLQTATLGSFSGLAGEIGIQTGSNFGIQVGTNKLFRITKPNTVNLFTLDAATSNAFFAGNVGIGTTSPWAKLSVDEPAGAVAFAIGSSTRTQFLVDQNGSVGVGLLSSSLPLSATNALTVGNGGNESVTFSRQGAETLFSDASGPIFQAYQRGSSYTSTPSTAAIVTNTQNGTGAANYLFSGMIGSTNTFSVRADGQGYFAGNVGIGSTSPSKLLTVGTNPGISNPLRAGIRLAGGGNNLGSWSTWDFETGASLVGDSQADTEMLRLSSNTVANIMTWQRATGNVGIGSTSPSGSLSVQSNSSTVVPFIVATSTGKTIQYTDAKGNQYSAGDLPTVGSCGSSPVIATGSNNNAGRVTVGSGLVSSCTVTFADGGWQSSANAPACTINVEGAALSLQAAPTKTAVVVTGGTITSDTFTYQCDGF